MVVGYLNDINLRSWHIGAIQRCNKPTSATSRTLRSLKHRDWGDYNSGSKFIIPECLQLKDFTQSLVSEWSIRSAIIDRRIVERHRFRFASRREPSRPFKLNCAPRLSSLVCQCLRPSDTGECSRGSHPECPITNLNGGPLAGKQPRGSESESCIAGSSPLARLPWSRSRWEVGDYERVALSPDGHLGTGSPGVPPSVTRYYLVTVCL